MKTAALCGDGAEWIRTWRRSPLAVVLGSALLCTAPMFTLPAQSADFTVPSGATDTVAKTLNAGETGEVEAGGTLTVAADAVTASGANVRFTNNGTATATSGNVVDSTGTGANLINNGTMSSRGGSAFLSSGTNSILTNNGTINNSAALANGLFATIGSEDSTVINNGTITATGTGADGVVAVGNRARLINRGTITAADEGIRHSGGSDATITNSGAVTTLNASADGIQSAGDNAAITNSGTITTSGDGAHGINSSGNNATITHSGAITVSGSNASGIQAQATGSTIIVSGSITATGSATQAILGGAGNETLNLMPGARIVGTIDLGTGNNAINVFTESGAQSSTLTIVNAGSVNATGGDGIVLRNGNTVAIVDPTGLSASRATLGTVTSGVHQAVGSQLAQSASPPPVQFAALTPDTAALRQPDSQFGWVRAFGGRKTRDDDGVVLAYESEVYGIVSGFEAAIGEHRIGALGGVSRAHVETEIESAETHTRSGFAGAYGEYVMGAWALGGALVAGYEEHDSERRVLDNLSGSQTALSDYDSYYVSPSVRLTRGFALPGGWTLRPSAEVSYTIGFYPGYTETGTTASNLTVDAHTVDVVGSRAQLAAGHRIADGRVSLEYRIGATYSHYGKDAIDLRLGNGATVRYEGAGETSSQGGYGGVNARYDVSDSLTLVADAEYGRASKQERTLLGSIGLELRF